MDVFIEIHTQIRDPSVLRTPSPNPSPFVIRSPPSYRGNASRFSARRPAKRSLSAICRHAAQLTGPESAIDYRGRNSRGLPPDTGYNNPAAARNSSRARSFRWRRNRVRVLGTRRLKAAHKSRTGMGPPSIMARPLP